MLLEHYPWTDQIPENELLDDHSNWHRHKILICGVSTLAQNPVYPEKIKENEFVERRFTDQFKLHCYFLWKSNPMSLIKLQVKHNSIQNIWSPRLDCHQNISKNVWRKLKPVFLELVPYRQLCKHIKLISLYISMTKIIYFCKINFTDFYRNLQNFFL